MLELSRQFVVFGNFNTITFDSLSKISALKEKYNFHTVATQDILTPNVSLGNNQQTPIMFPVPQSRPVFQTDDMRTTVFFGSSRIHIEQNNFENGYAEFNAMSVEIVEGILNLLGVRFNRLALNGQLLITDKKRISEKFNEFFKESKVYNIESQEWLFRVESKEKNSDLKCELNKIVSYNRANVIEASGEIFPRLIANYDFSTQVGMDRFYSKEDIALFNKLGQEYRTLFME